MSENIVPEISSISINDPIYKANGSSKLNLLNMNRNQLREFFLSIGEKIFRADQVMKWIYHHYCDNFDQMTNINKQLRTRLKHLTEISAPEVIEEHRSIDGTIKWALKIENQQIETVYIPEKYRATLCISSQLGCALKCSFCSTAKQGFNRNLRVSEIIGQVWRAIKLIDVPKAPNKCPITNIVIMGMGEPLLNLANIVPSIEIMLDDFGFGLSKRHITLSTSGIVPALNKLKNMIDVVLAISLHAPNNNIRNKIVPINRKYNIKNVLSSANQYINQSKANKGRVTIEYVMIYNVNDKIEHAHQLAISLKNTPCKINLIPWNQFPGSGYTRSSNTRIDRFAKILISYGFITIIRKTRGDDINAACGQLVGRVIDRTNRSIHKYTSNKPIEMQII